MTSDFQRKPYAFLRHRTFIGIIAIAMLWIVGYLQGIGQKRDVQDQWTVESHDNTNFPLIGKHRVTSCRECHLNLVFEGTPTECESCHWERRQDDRYQLRLGMHCDDCHTPYSWKNVSPAKWNHKSATGYPLEGVHRTLDCAECHGENGFDKLMLFCSDCHDKDFRESRNPDHQAAGFSLRCQLCHLNQNTWKGAVFSHDRFLLKGGHKSAECSDCHSSGQYSGLPAICVSCHLDDYNNTTDPDHQVLSFPTDCEDCHGTSTSTWGGASYVHTSFVLVGQHKLAQCSDCHQDGKYAGTSSACVSCHQDDYNSTVDPDHQSLNFSTECEDCHGAGFISWKDVTFDHSVFWPLQGAHTSLDCSSCHTQGYGLPQNCYGCHSQDYDNTSDPDHSTAGFPTDCEYCHYPTHFSWSQAVFDHQFPIGSGKHTSASCTDCHLTSDYRLFSCLECHTHRRTRMDRQHEDVIGYVYESLACFACHPEGR